MSRFTIRHETTYHFDRAVAFGPWRLIMRPVDTHGLRLLDAQLTLVPPGITRWSTDAAGNSVCLFEPQGMSDTLSVINQLVIERFPSPLAPPQSEDPRSTFPLFYDASDRAVLEPYLRPATEDSDENYLGWIRRFTNGDRLALDVLHDINRTIHAEFGYGARFEEGVQTPAQTVARHAGTCRDFAWLMIETCRRIGFAARFITGYLFSPGADVRGAGATHAWCEVFLPVVGWIAFDPTNGLTESPDLIRIAATRTPDEASPMSGSIIGHATSTMTVRVDVDQTDFVQDNQMGVQVGVNAM